MANALQKILQIKDPRFTQGLRQLEAAAGRSGVDTRLIADMIEVSHRVMRQLGLSPADTTPWELYQALIARADDDQLLADTSYVAVEIEGQVISFNQQDLQVSRGGSFESRTLEAVQNSLRQEIVDRYVEHPAVNRQFVYMVAIEVGIIPSDYIDNKNNKEIRNMDDSPKILAVGDIISNAFIRLTEDFFKVTTDEEGHEWLSMELGAKLSYDDVDIVKVSECSPNAAVSVARLGLDSHLMTWVGGDEVGQEMLEYLAEEKVDTAMTSVQEGKKSSYHYVLRYGADRTKLQRFEDYNYQWQDPEFKPDWLYLGVLGEKTWDFHLAILDYLKRNPDVKLAFQPGMYHLLWGAEKLAEFYEHAEIVIMNREEAAQVTGRSRQDIKQLLDGLHDLGVSIAVVTDGPAGAYASNKTEQLFMPNFPDPKEPYERTGAGDAFASTLVAALALGKPLAEALRWAPINSAYVVQQIGAQAGLLTRDELLGHLESAPEWYHTKTLEEHLAEK